ncbi:hypothetical protein JW698_02400 [Candidatus Wolfebacteria bacterium]|nr:hypothetical protein [Candidatus Wolfebacteria bacterium]
MTKKKKITTIEDLATIVQREFLFIRGEFATVNKKLEKMQNEILEIKSDINDLKLRMGKMVFGFEFRDIEKRVKKLETKAGIK